MIRRLLPWAVFGSAAIAAGLFLVWLVLAQRLEAAVAAWAESRRAEGYVLDWTRLDIGGFPLRFALTFADARIARDGWSAEATLLSADLAPWRPDRIDLAAPRFAVAGPGGGLAMETATATLALEDGRASRLVVEGSAATASIRAGELGRAERARLVVDRFAPEAPDWRTESLVGQATFWRARPAAVADARLLFDEPFDLDIAGAVKGPLATLEHWRDVGGTIELDRLTFVWGPLKVDGNATISLDGEMRPLGAGTATIRGVDPTLDRLAASGQVKPGDAAIAKVVLGLMAKPAADGASELTVPVTAQDGRLHLGTVPVLALPKLAE